MEIFNTFNSNDIDAEVMIKATSLYGDHLSDIIATRLKTELAYIKEQGLASVYLMSHLVTKYAHDNRQPTRSRGGIGASFVAFLIGITNINPLPPHYYCENCKCTEFMLDNSIYSGYDLPKKECPICGKILTQDGHNIPFESITGLDNKNSFDIDININIPFSFRDNLLQYLNSSLPNEYALTADTNLISIKQVLNPSENINCNSIVDILGVTSLDTLYLLEKYTGVSIADVDITDPKIYELFLDSRSIGIDSDEPATYGLPELGNNFTREIIKKIKPKNFGELTKINNYTHSTNMTDENVKNILSDNFPNERITFSKSHSVEFTKIALQLAWYKIYYPAEFYTATFKVRYPDFDLNFFAKNTDISDMHNFEILKELDKDELALLKEYISRNKILFNK